LLDFKVFSLGAARMMWKWFAERPVQLLQEQPPIGSLAMMSLSSDRVLESAIKQLQNTLGSLIRTRGVNGFICTSDQCADYSAWFVS
jgi:hypothetical protein